MHVSLTICVDSVSLCNPSIGLRAALLRCEFTAAMSSLSIIFLIPTIISANSLVQDAVSIGSMSVEPSPIAIRESNVSCDARLSSIARCET
jgi:hypothetical protein